MLEDIEQLNALYTECGPQRGDRDLNASVAYLVDTMFFKLKCLRVSIHFNGVTMSRMFIDPYCRTGRRLESSCLRVKMATPLLLNEQHMMPKRGIVSLHV